MIIPLVNNARVYDGIVNSEIIGLKISPCENYLAIITKETLQIVSNRHNRILICRFILTNYKEEFGIVFNGSLEWSNNSKLLILGSSSYQHVFVFRLHLHSPLEITNEDGYLSRSESSFEDSGDDEDDMDNEDDNGDENENGREKLRDNVSRKSEFENFLIKDSISNINHNEKFVFITEELENGLINIPSVNVPDEIFNSFQEDLLTFQLISEYGTLTEKNEKPNLLEAEIEFSTSYAKLELIGVINIFHKYDSFLLIFDENINENVILFTLNEFPILILITLSNLSLRRRNIFLSDFISFNQIQQEYDHSFQNCSASFLDPIYNLDLNKRNFFSGYFDSSIPNKEIKLESLERLNSTSKIQENIEKLSIPANFKLSGISLMENLINQNHFGFDFSLENKPNLSGFGLGNLEYNVFHDWLTILLKPFNSLLLFSWNSPLSFDNNNKEFNSSCTNNDQIKNFIRSPFGYIIKSKGVFSSKILNNHKRIVIICNESLQINQKLGIEFEICDDHIDSNFELNINNQKVTDGLKNGITSSINQQELYIEVLSFEEIPFKQEGNDFQMDDNLFVRPKIISIFSLKFSEFVSDIVLFSKIPLMTVSNSDLFITITIEEGGIFVFNSFSGKLHFKICKDKSKNENPQLFNHAVMITNDLSMFYQVKIKTEDESENKDEDQAKFCLIELPIYKLMETRSSFCKFSNFDQSLPCCENLIFLGMESIGILQCNNRSFGLDLDSDLESKFNSNTIFTNPNHLVTDQAGKHSIIEFNSNNEMIGDINVKFNSSYHQRNTSDFCGIISSCIEFHTDLLIQSIPIPPSIYINHNWPINEAYVNKSGNYILVSGHRGCAIYDLINSRWRLFCDLNHELLLCKPNLPFGWINEWVFFLTVNSSLLLNTFHELITSNDDLWEVSAFEKNKLYESYIQVLCKKLKIIKSHQNRIDNNEESCIVFFDIRDSLDIRNIIGLIPFCSSLPLLVANSIFKSKDNLFILYTDDFVLTAYEDENPSNYSSIPSEIKWVIDLSEVWNDHPVEILLIRKCPEFCIFLILHKDWKLYKLTVYYQRNENSLNKKCEFKFQPVIKSSSKFDENLNNLNNPRIIRFGFIEFCSYFQDSKSTDEPLESIKVTSSSPDSLSFDNILKDAINLLQDEFKMTENEISKLLNNKNLRNFMKSCLNQNMNTFSDKLPLYWEGIEELDIFGIIWYLTESQEIFLLPLINEAIYQETIKYSPLTPILVQSFQTKLNYIHVVNFFPSLASFLLLELYSGKIKANNQTNFKSILSKSLHSLVSESRIILTISQSISPVLQDLINIPNKLLRSKLIKKFLSPIINYIKIYPLENIFKILINIFENMLFSILKDSCKDYKKIQNILIDRMVSFSIQNDLFNENIEQELMVNFLKEIFHIVAPNLKICNKSLCDDENVGNILEEIQSGILNLSPSIQEMKQLLEMIKELLDIQDLKVSSIESLSSIININSQSNIFAYLIISIIRKIDPVIAPCIVFPLIHQNPNDIFQECIKSKNFSNAMLYLTILQSFLGPYFVRYEHSLLLLHNILSSINMANHHQLLPLVNQTMKFIFIIFKPNNLTLKTPLSQFPEPISIIEMNNCNNLQLDYLIFLNKIDSILEFHFLSKLLKIEWLYLLLMCKSLGMNFNSWFSYCLQKYYPLWFVNENFEDFCYFSSSNFFNLVISIQNKFNLFNLKENIICLLDESSQENFSNKPEEKEKELQIENEAQEQVQRLERGKNNSFSKTLNNNPLSNVHKNNPEFFFQNISIQNNLNINQIIKPFFKAFLSNSFPIPALAIAYACNDMYSFHKVLHDFPHLRKNLHAIT